MHLRTYDSYKPKEEFVSTLGKYLRFKLRLAPVLSHSPGIEAATAFPTFGTSLPEKRGLWEFLFLTSCRSSGRVGAFRKWSMAGARSPRLKNKRCENSSKCRRSCSFEQLRAKFTLTAIDRQCFIHSSHYQYIAHLPSRFLQQP